MYKTGRDRCVCARALLRFNTHTHKTGLQKEVHFHAACRQSLVWSRVCGAPTSGTPAKMLAELVNGGGCVAEGSDAVNNPLSRLTKSVLDGHQHGMASSSHDVSIAGPSSSSGVLPSMGPAELAFMEAFERGTSLQDAWDASGSAAGSFAAAPFPPDHLMMAQAEAAWLQGVPQQSGHSAALEAAACQRAGHVVRDSLRSLSSGNAVPQPMDALLSGLGLNPEEHASAVKRAQTFAAHLRPVGATPTVGVAHGQSQQYPVTAVGAGLISPHLSGLPPQPQFVTGSAPLASHLSKASRGFEATNATSQEARRASDATSSELEAAYLETLGEALQAPATAADAEAAFGGSFEAMEKVWQQLSGGGANNPLGSGSPELEAVWESLRGGDAAWDGLWGEVGRESDAEAVYRFRPSNPHLGEADLVARGTALFEAGELQEAMLLLEAAVTADPEDSIAWQTLGQTHADADDDAQAIACLRRAVAADPHNLDALLALGVSYTNELDQTRALRHLQMWLESHPDFSELGSAAGLDAETAAPSVPFALQRRVTDLFGGAVRLAPHNADLHAVLGVLHNLTRSYPEAVASFEEALRLRPTDYSLWNKLGATRANAMSCAEAVPCYVRAIELKPQYVRSLSNLGISYGNLSDYQAAAQCYLKALSLNPEATHIWGYLTMVFTSSTHLHTPLSTRPPPLRAPTRALPTLVLHPSALHLPPSNTQPSSAPLPAVRRPDLVEKAATGDHRLFFDDFDFN